MRPIDLCEASLLQPFVRCLETRGIPADRYLKRQRISPEQVAMGSGKILRVSAWSFFKEVEYREGFESLGFLEGDPYSITDLGAFGAALQAAVTLRDAIETFCRLMPSLADDNKARLIEGPDQSWLVCRTDRFDRTAHASDHYTILILREVIRLAAGADWRPEKIRFLSESKEALDKIHRYR